jgi:hypothetical protein
MTDKGNAVRENTHAAVADSGDSNDFHKSLLSNLASSFNLNRQNPRGGSKESDNEFPQQANRSVGHSPTEVSAKTNMFAS